MHRTKPSHYVLLGLLLCWLGALLLYPIWLTVRGGFATDVMTGQGFTLRHVGLVFRDPALRGGLQNALMIALATTTLCALIGVPLGVLSARYTYPFKKVWDAAVLVPLILPPFVGAIGLKAILGRTGALNALLRCISIPSSISTSPPRAPTSIRRWMKRLVSPAPTRSFDSSRSRCPCCARGCSRAGRSC